MKKLLFNAILLLKILLNSKEQNVNISSLPKGIYIAVIYAKSGTSVKKIQKI